MTRYYTEIFTEEPFYHEPGIVFDLDDTLYLERDYVRSGFSFIADLMAKDQRGRKKSSPALWGLFLQGERKHL